jgi:hypothetical protein
LFGIDAPPVSKAEVDAWWATLDPAFFQEYEGLEGVVRRHAPAFVRQYTYDLELGPEFFLVSKALRSFLNSVYDLAGDKLSPNDEKNLVMPFIKSMPFYQQNASIINEQVLVDKLRKSFSNKKTHSSRRHRDLR